MAVLPADKVKKLIHIQIALLAGMLGLLVVLCVSPRRAPVVEWQSAAIRPDEQPRGFGTDTIVSVNYYRIDPGHVVNGPEKIAYDLASLINELGSHGWRVDTTLRDGTIVLSRPLPLRAGEWPQFDLRHVNLDDTNKPASRSTYGGAK